MSTKSKAMRVGEAKELVEHDRTLPLREGQKWYILSSKWWADFLSNEQLEDHNTRFEMDPISNRDIIESDNKHGFKLKPGLISNNLATLVSEAVFNRLRETFGVEHEERDVIVRSVVKGTLMQDNVFIEVYPLEIKIADYSKKDQVFTMYVSQADSIDNIRKTIMDQLKIDEDERNNAKFIIENDGQFEVLPETISYLKLGAVLNSGNVVYVDTSGTSPQELQAQNGSRSSGRYSEGALQCLSNVPELTQYFLKDEHLKEINTTNPLGTHGRLVKAYGDLLKNIWSGNSNSVRPCSLKCVIGEFAPRFNGYAQQDSQELTAFLLDGLHEDLNRIMKKPYVEEKEMEGQNEAQAALEAWQDYKKRNDSIIVDLLHGQLKSTLTCNICSKISVKFDPFCYLSLPIPARERPAKSTIYFVRKDKWAKFSLTHTNKTTILQLKNVLREHLKIPADMQIVLITFYGSDILEDDKLIGVRYNYNDLGKQFYAYAIDGADQLLMVENRTLTNQTLGHVFPVRRPDKITRQFVIDTVLPLCRDYFWLKNAGTSASKDKVCEEPTLVSEPIEDDINQQYSEIEPDQINLLVPNSNLRPFPEDPNEELPCSTLTNDGSVPKIVIYWKENNQFGNVNPDSLVEREVNISKIKKAYTLKECIDLYTTEEQLSEEDTWYCPKCKTHQRAFKKLDLWSLPQILIIHLKRFLYSRYTRDKIETEIEVPVRGFDLGDKVRDPSHKQEKYDLIGVSNHSGGLGSGHYTARALNNGVWCEFNDSSAYTLTTPLADSFISREAYMLYYRRRQTDDSKQTLKSPNKTETSMLI